MKHTILSNSEFISKCPYAFQINGYASTLINKNEHYDFTISTLGSNNIYTVQYDVYDTANSHHNKKYTLIIKCDISDKNAFKYSYTKIFDNQ